MLYGIMFNQHVFVAITKRCFRDIMYLPIPSNKTNYRVVVKYVTPFYLVNHINKSHNSINRT